MIGMTLMEILVVMMLIALVLGIAIPSFNSLTHSRLRKSAVQISGMIRYLYDQAALKGLCMRVVFDLQKNTYHVEASSEGTCLVDSKPKTAQSAKKKEDDKNRKKKKKPSSSTSDTTIGGWSGEKPISLEVKKALFQKLNAGLLRERQLPEGVSFGSVFVSHQKEPYSKKKALAMPIFTVFPLAIANVRSFF